MTCGICGRFASILLVSFGVTITIGLALRFILGI